MGYLRIREIIAILKNKLWEGPPLKKSKTGAGQATPELFVQVRYLLVVPKDKPQSQNLQWKFPKGWSSNCKKNDHRGDVYCLEVPLTVCSTIIKNISSFELIASRYTECMLEMCTFYIIVGSGLRPAQKTLYCPPQQHFFISVMIYLKIHA